MRVISVLNQKGGVGKTTTVVNVAAALAESGQRVLVMDLDPQAHLTIHLGVDAEQKDCGIYKVLSSSARLDEAMVQVRSNLWLLGAGIDLVGAEAELVNEVGREIILRQALEPMKDHFDYVIIDCPPSLGLLTLNALATSTEVMIPIQPHFLALQGFSRLLQTVALVQSRINPALRVSAILMCMFDARASLSTEVRQDIERFLSGSRNQNSPWAGAQIIPVHVRRNIKLAEAPSYGKTIFEYEPACHGAADYLAVAEFIHTGKIEGVFEIKKAAEPVIETATEVATEPVTETMTESIAENATAAADTTESITPEAPAAPSESVAESMTQTTTEIVTENVTAVADTTEPVMPETPAEPVAEIKNESVVVNKIPIVEIAPQTYTNPVTSVPQDELGAV